MARAPIRQVTKPADIVPHASPVDAYVRPPDPPRSQLHDLAKGLANLDRGLSGFLDKRTAKQNDLDKVRGEAAFNRDHRESWAEAVRTGVVPPNASPVFMESWKRARGKLIGTQLSSRLDKAYAQWDGKDSDDPAAYQSFIATFMAENLKGIEDPHVLAGLNPHVKRMQENSYNAWSKFRADETYKGSIDTARENMTAAAVEAEKAGHASTTGTDYNALWVKIVEQRDEIIKSGVKAEDGDGAVANTIIAEAVRTKDTEMLALLERKTPGSKYPMSYAPEVRKARDAALNTIQSAQATAETKTLAAQKAADTARSNLYTREVSRLVFKDPTIVIPEDTMDEWLKVNPDALSKLEKLRKTAVSAREGTEDDTAIMNIHAKLRGGAGSQYVQQMFENEVIKNAATYDRLMKIADKYDEARATGSGILADPAVKRIQKRITNLTGTGTFDWQGQKGLSDDGQRAIADLDIQLMEWEEANPKATALERRKAIEEIGQGVLKDIPNRDATKTGRYEPDEEVPADNLSEQDDADAAAGGVESLTAPAEQQPAPALPEPAAPAEKAPVPNLGPPPEPPETPAPGDEEEDALNTYPKEYQERVKSFAKSQGMTPDQAHAKFNERANKLIREARAENLKDTEVGKMTTEHKSRLVNLLRNPPKLPGASIEGVPIKGILNLIGAAEGTDRGDGYNETLGYGAFTGGDVNLVGMTLREIDQLQTKMLAHPNNKWNSSALGRYQIVRTTLRSLRKRLNLKPNVVFTGALQDKLAAKLLEGRGLGKWMRGEVSDRHLLNSLAKEWASLPNSRGRGHYGGQKARKTTGDVLSAITNQGDKQ